MDKLRLYNGGGEMKEEKADGSIINLDEQKDILKEEKFVKEKRDEEEQVIPSGNRRVVTYPIDFTINSLNEQIGNESIILDEGFQRRMVWNNVKSSKLIESLFLNVPIPVCYFAEIKDGIYSVIDGKQRLGSIRKFWMNDLRLRGLKVLSTLNKKKFADLEPGQKRQLGSRTIRCIVILKESDPKVRYDIFERLNTNSVALNKQELRNCIYIGKLNKLLKELARNKQFQKVRNVNQEDLRMNDRELILRFFAFHERLSSYRPPLGDFLDSYLKDGISDSDDRIAELQRIFLRAINDVDLVFGNMAFRKFDSDKNKWESRVNRAIYDVIMLSFANLDSEDIQSKKEEIIGAFKKLCENTEFLDAITTWTKQVEAIQKRLSLWSSKLRDLGLELPEFKVGVIAKH